MKITKEDMEVLAPYEQIFWTSIKAGWARHPGPAALQNIGAILSRVSGTERRINNACQSCVLHAIQEAGRLYFAEKERLQVELSKQEAERKKVAVETTEKPKAVKSPAKRKKSVKSKAKQ